MKTRHMKIETTPFFQRNQLPAKVGAAIAAKREAAELTRRELADQAGIDYWTLGRIERNKQRPTPETLRSLAAVLNIPMDEFCETWGKVEEDRPRAGVVCFGVGFRGIRQSAGITLKQVAATTGISISTLCRFERGMFATPRRIAEMFEGGPHTLQDSSLTGSTLANLLGFGTPGELESACATFRENGLGDNAEDDLDLIPTWLLD